MFDDATKKWFSHKLLLSTARGKNLKIHIILLRSEIQCYLVAKTTHYYGSSSCSFCCSAAADAEMKEIMTADAAVAADTDIKL